MLENSIKIELAKYIDPYLNMDLIQAKCVRDLSITETDIRLHVVMPYPVGKAVEVVQNVTDLLSKVAEDRNIHISLSTKIDGHKSVEAAKTLPGIKNIIAVASGKGGVGKSTVAVNLALALAHEGAIVGMLDADIYGPSQPSMLGTIGEKPRVENGKLIPVNSHGIQSMSIGYLIADDAPMVWRGPMIGKALQQLINDTDWQNLDYLIVDLPPGTGDIQITLCQKLPLSGVVMVTTPQDLALLDVGRAAAMFQKLNVPMLGVVENMSQYTCAHCGQAENIFGEGGAQKLADTFALDLLIRLPLKLATRLETDAGNPPALRGEPDFIELARKVSAKIALQPKDYSGKFPNIVVK